MAEALYSRSRYEKSPTVGDGMNGLLLLYSLIVLVLGGWRGSITALGHCKALHMGSRQIASMSSLTKSIGKKRHPTRAPAGPFTVFDGDRSYLMRCR